MEITRNFMWGILLVFLCAGAYSTEVSGQEAIENRFLQLENRLPQLESTIDEMQSTIVEQQSTIDEMQSTIDELLCNHIQLPGDCQEAYELGFRDAGPHLARLENGQLVHLLCDMDDQHQWTIIQQRKQGDVLFNRSYVEYQQGFGTLGAESDFWLGLDAIHQITSVGDNMLRVDLTDWEGETRYAEYSTFRVSSENQKYWLTIGGYSGDAGDSMTYHHHQGFSTYDHDVDLSSIYNCATSQGGGGGWWFASCYIANLNGRYISPPQHDDTWLQGINWQHGWRTPSYSYKATKMKVRRLNP